MKKIMLSLVIIYASFASAQKKDTVYANANLTNATVYFGYGADLKHSSKTNLVSGMQQLIISNVSLYPDMNTIQISCPENVTILSYTHRIYSKPPVVVPPPTYQKSYDSIKNYHKQINVFTNDQDIKNDMMLRITKLIENNFTTPDKKNITSEELVKLTTYYTDKISLLKQQVFDLEDKKNNLNEIIAAIEDRLNRLSQENKPTEQPKPVGQLILQVMSKMAGPVDFDFNYFTRNAGWVPTYDIRVKTIDNSFKLVYKAMVSQTTGLNWNGVKLNLSTSNPNQGNTIPVLSPTYLQLYVPAIYDKVISASNESYVAPMMLDEVVVTGYAKDLAKKPAYATTKLEVKDFLTLKESQLNTNFEIDLPYDIPSDGQAYSVTIKDEMIPATYQHVAVPKLDEDAFLIAKLNNWDSLSLLPGVASIIMDNVYLGKSYLNPNTTEDTLSISMGRDKRIAINRKLVKEYNKVKRNDSKIEFYTYEIIVKNNKKQSIDMNLSDQFPISQTKEIEVTLTDSGDAEVDNETGFLKWKVKLKPGESKKYRFSYNIKYPKDKVLQELK
ncbi:MAG: DUF4139 domain-containing protein [Bacteroidota bacterium]